MLKNEFGFKQLSHVFMLEICNKVYLLTNTAFIVAGVAVAHQLRKPRPHNCQILRQNPDTFHSPLLVDTVC